jgi:hypothetical protein
MSRLELVDETAHGRIGVDDRGFVWLPAGKDTWRPAFLRGDRLLAIVDRRPLINGDVGRDGIVRRAA